MTCASFSHRRVTGALRKRNVLILKACGCVFSGVFRAVTRVEQLASFGANRKPVGWWRKRAGLVPGDATDVVGETEWGLEMTEKAMAQYLPGLFY